MAELLKIELLLDLSLNEVEKTVGERYLQELIETSADLLYQQDVEVEINLVDGSLKAYILVLGTLYIAIGQYGSFRSGLEYLKQDADTIFNGTMSQLYKNGL